ncbi:hypothetical protein FNU79_03775 [Deinococcus detaillensis]|uniref:Nuclease n=1 Tax=Deinococcus detaillensis TaxID=2592048 RepID=A0A553V5D6_9DEIO|nr:hypothetical protein [Deinococcus detaillensis]TSA87604.1 hypothetical protein FNU79_03775 [Deinococcus detaillensis]
MMALLMFRRALLVSLLLSSPALAQSSGVSGRLLFFNDECSFMLDLGLNTPSSSLGGKLSGVKCKEGAAAAVRKLITKDARVQFKVTKVSSYPEGTLTFRNQDIADWLVSKKLAVRGS